MALFISKSEVVVNEGFAWLAKHADHDDLRVRYVDGHIVSLRCIPCAAVLVMKPCCCEIQEDEINKKSVVHRFVLEASR